MYYVKNLQCKVYFFIILILQYGIVHYKHAVQMIFVKFFHLEFQKLSVNTNSHDFLPKAPETTTLFSTSESLNMLDTEPFSQ